MFIPGLDVHSTLRDSALLTLGSTVRMLCFHFIELAKCPHGREVAFRKARGTI